jgi:transposase InsO family protein
VRSEIAQTKQRNPAFGLRKVRDWLLRFRGIRVSAGTVRSALRERGIQGTPPQRPRRRRLKVVGHFERAKPMQLWQTDITSYVLTRHSTRVYLVVFLDDYSRYVVSWSLCTHAKGGMVIECLLDGIARFGKPEEVLSDRGPQFCSWRGKSGFKKLLVREGIEHVMARTHHPQTVGKCERLWKTIGAELWERARPQDLTEARERLRHYFAHYNHFRPHQGIDGLVPADRFFGAENALRKTLEEQMAANELQLALDLPPRQPVYLFGQIGDRQVALVGEHGRVVVHTEEGALHALSADNNQGTEDAGDGRHQRSSEAVRAQAEADAHGPQAHALRSAPAPGAVGAAAVAGGELRGADAGAPAVDGDPGILAGQGQQAGDRASPGDPAAAGMAALADGALGHAGRTPAAAQDAAARTAERDAGEPGGRPAAAEATHPRAGAQAGTDGGPGAGAQGPALGSEVGRAQGGEPCKPAAPHRPPPAEAAWAFGIPPR